MKENQKNGRRMDGRETEEKIIKCAGQLIAEKGFASVTSKEICRAAGVNLAAVNYHFGSRDGLYLAVLENVQQYLVELQQLIDLYESDLTPRQKMEKLIDFLAGNAFRKNEWQISVWVREVMNPSPMLEKIFQKEALPKISVIIKIFSDSSTSLAGRSLSTRIGISYSLFIFIEYIFYVTRQLPFFCTDQENPLLKG